MNKYLRNEHIQKYLPTIGVDFGTKIISSHNKSIKLHIWDTSGHINYRNIVRSYYGSVAGAVLLYDKTNLATFQSLPNWISDFNNVNNNHNLPIMVIATKTDLPSAVTDEEVTNFVQQYNILYNEVNLNTTQNIPDVLEPLWDTIWKTYITTNKKCAGIKRSNILTQIQTYPHIETKSTTTADKFFRKMDTFQSKCIIS
jgi:small GTP-binding protein